MMISASIVSSTGHGTGIQTYTLNSSSDIMSDGISEPSSPESSFDSSDLLGDDEVSVQLAAAGTVGLAAAAAIAGGRKKKRPHSFETNPSIRKRQQTRLLRKLKQTIEEYTTRVGQQAVVLCCTPGKMSNSNNNYKVFGSQPLESVMRNCKGVILQDLETSLSETIPHAEHQGAQELPSLSIDGIPTSVEKMTQAQLRTFIPEMLKYSTGRSKPGWGKMECRPVWWPDDVPWANVRSDVRTTEQKKKVSWTDALKSIVKNCYRHHGREDLLHVFETESSYQRTMLQTINNPDGTVSIIQIDTSPNQIVTLPDGTQATVVHAIHPGVPNQEASQAVQTLANPSGDNLTHMTPVSVEMNADSLAQSIATISEDGQIILTGDNALNGIVIPVSMYQQLTNPVTALHSGTDLHVAMAPMGVPKDDDINVIPDIQSMDSQSPDVLEHVEPKLEET